MLIASRLVLYLASLTCAAAICPPDYRLDIIFVVDSDGSTARSKYHIFYDVITEFLARYPIGDNLTKVGLITFDTNPRTVLPPSGDKEYLLKKLKRIEYSHNTVNAIPCLLAASGTFTDKEVRRVVVLETDGTDKKRDSTIRMAKTLKNKGIDLYVFGIRPRIDHDELVGVATKPEFYFEADSYSDYMQFVDLLSDLVCNDRGAEEDE